MTNPPEAPESVLQRILARLPEGAVFSGRTAAWIYGLDLPPCSPVDVTVPFGSQVAARAGMAFHRSRMEGHERCFHRAYPVTAPLRTVIDLARRLPLVDAVVAVDMALHAELATQSELWSYAAEHRGGWGVRRLRIVTSLSESATESPMETRLRLILVQGGLPRPEAQVSIHDRNGDFVARPDFLYAMERLAIEFDGGVHRAMLVEDNRRQNRLLAAGYRVLRFTSSDISQPDKIVAEVSAALKARVSRETISIA